MTTGPDGRTLIPGGSVYRPPSEHASLLLQVTVGCSHNRCSYCAMYQGKRFAIRPHAEIEALLDHYAKLAPAPSGRVFLCDGDALIMPQKRLVSVLSAIRERLPWVRRVCSYGDTRSVLRKSIDELKELRALGLGMIYHGVETGDEQSMAAIVKGATRAEAIETAQRLKAAGILHSVIVLLGIGGVGGSARHAEATASLLSEMDPAFVGALTVTPVPGTPLHDAAESGAFELPTKFQMLGELRTIIAGADLTGCRFSSNHASNYLPLRGQLPRDKAGMLRALDQVLAAGDERMLKPEWMRGL
ncbi:MAG: radical SAM protein [Myxococcales bacterium]|nr:radical SAM protein [Myxococcales bacterium]